MNMRTLKLATMKPLAVELVGAVRKEKLESRRYVRCLEKEGMERIWYRRKKPMGDRKAFFRAAFSPDLT